MNLPHLIIIVRCVGKHLGEEEKEEEKVVVGLILLLLLIGINKGNLVSKIKEKITKQDFLRFKFRLYFFLFCL